MKKYYLISTFISPFFLISCSSTKTIKFSEQDNDVYTTEKLSEFLRQNKNPKVVLRVSNTSLVITDQENNDYLYNAIENQLLASGFVVRDRQLFNQIIDNENNNINYEKLKNDQEYLYFLKSLKNKRFWHMEIENKSVKKAIINLLRNIEVELEKIK